MNMRHTWSYATPTAPQQAPRRGPADVLGDSILGVGHAVATAFARHAARVRRERRARETYRELSRLSDRELNDIGLLRGEIATIADAVTSQPPRTGVTLADLRGS